MRWRFRTNWMGKLILQIGRRQPRLSGLPGDTYIKWTDAKTEELGHYYAKYSIKEEA